MKAVRLGLILCLVMMFAACSLKPTWDIIGKWQKTEGGETIEFARNGNMTLTNGKTSVTVPFKFGDPQHLQIDLGSIGMVTAQTAVGKDSLTITDANGKVSTYKRVK